MKHGSFLIPAVLLALITTTLIVISCKKSNNGKPTLSLESISNPVQVNDSLRIRFKFTGGGSITNGLLWSLRNRINQLPATNPSGGDTVYFQLPSFSGGSGEIYLSLPWQGYLNETATENDSDIFKFYVQNAVDSTTSDTITTKAIVVLYQ
ncbi:MAG TPA: hypothetical protein VFE32_11880 [Puia sp.]|jgi:hypothetical protein|nr:hypothetical protein [Puia sp.]